MDKITESWSKFGLLSELPEAKHKMMAHALESQRIFNEYITRITDGHPEVEDTKRLRRISIPLVRRVFQELDYDKVCRVDSMFPSSYVQTNIKWNPEDEKYQTPMLLDGECEFTSDKTAELVEFLKKRPDLTFRAFGIRERKYDSGTIQKTIAVYVEPD